MKVLVTGATGKVGSRFVPRLLQWGHTVRVLVRNTERAQTLKQQGAELVDGDLLQKGSLAEILRGMDAVVHLAAQFRGVSEEVARATNIDGTITLAQTALEMGVRKFVFASTNLVYGDGNKNRPSLEDDDLRPTRAYPQTKSEAEQALLHLHRTQGLGVRIIRLAFVYGEKDPHITEFLPIIKKWNPAKRLHMVHHADVSQALLLAASTHGIDGRIYNVADDAPITVAELLQAHGEQVPSSTEEIPQDFNPWDMMVDTTRIRRELNYRPVYPSFYTARDAGAL